LDLLLLLIFLLLGFSPTRHLDLDMVRGCRHL
jgi:hypothetical protein